jgi:hypothetical protein
MRDAASSGKQDTSGFPVRCEESQYNPEGAECLYWAEDENTARFEYRRIRFTSDASRARGDEGLTWSFFLTAFAIPPGLK